MIEAHEMILSAGENSEVFNLMNGGTNACSRSYILIGSPESYLPCPSYMLELLTRRPQRLSVVLSS